MIIGIVGAFAAAAFIPLGAYDFTGLIYFLTIVFGVAGLGWNAIFLTIAAEFPEKKLAGTATGIVFLISNLGVIVGPPLFGFLIDLTGSYTLSWLFVAMCMVMVASLSKARRKEYPPF